MDSNRMVKLHSNYNFAHIDMSMAWHGMCACLDNRYSIQFEIIYTATIYVEKWRAKVYSILVYNTIPISNNVMRLMRLSCFALLCFGLDPTPTIMVKSIWAEDVYFYVDLCVTACIQSIRTSNNNLPLGYQICRFVILHIHTVNYSFYAAYGVI